MLSRRGGALSGVGQLPAEGLGPIELVERTDRLLGVALELVAHVA